MEKAAPALLLSLLLAATLAGAQQAPAPAAQAPETPPLATTAFGDASARMTVPVMLGAVLLWDFLVRVMQGVTIAFMEDIWSRNFLNIFSTPLTIAVFSAEIGTEVQEMAAEEEDAFTRQLAEDSRAGPGAELA